jgi:hypothetical protein
MGPNDSLQQCRVMGNVLQLVHLAQTKELDCPQYCLLSMMAEDFSPEDGDSMFPKRWYCL